MFTYPAPVLMQILDTQSYTCTIIILQEQIKKVSTSQKKVCKYQSYTLPHSTLCFNKLVTYLYQDFSRRFERNRDAILSYSWRSYPVVLVLPKSWFSILQVIVGGAEGGNIVPLLIKRLHWQCAWLECGRSRV